ncbi:hypothetical protein [Cellulomonas phragmiteti]|uniref:Uncharacterized protein n=1 Tax=Cellulomonas phragmiteti TaxID=478780 RepID=A0ABQ4DNM6_9CELL|nr:hypothetical protein [Cellulomonas phragmiteti]GIG40958.1 hypothetical protein Cph01nite_27200 [Cellulomonas phragmiteti]
MDKTRRLRNAAEGFMAGLVAAGFEGPFRWAAHQWEGPFRRAWRSWEPQQRNPRDFPTFGLGGSADGRTSQPRDMLFQLKRTSPFHDYRTHALPTQPSGLTPEDYLDINATGATPAELRQLALTFLDEMAKSSTSD